MAGNSLAGAIDLHTHSGPSLFNRAMDDFGLAAEAKEAGMRAVVIKAHECPTAARAALVNSRVEGVEVFGGIALNRYVGGFNLSAVDAALTMGGKIVWFPTIDAQQSLKHFRLATPPVHHLEAPLAGLTVLDEAGHLKPEVKPILQCIAEANAILGTGHLSAREILVLTEAAIAIGVRKILITHVDADFIGLTLEDQVYLAQKGAMLEKCYFTLFGLEQSVSGKSMADGIKIIGAEHCVLVTDLGQAANLHPVDGMRVFVDILMEAGVSRQEIHLMLVENPARLLGL